MKKSGLIFFVLIFASLSFAFTVRSRAMEKTDVDVQAQTKTEANKDGQQSLIKKTSGTFTSIFRNLLLVSRDNITVSNHEYVNPNQLLELLDEQTNYFIWDLYEKDVEKIILTDPWVSEVKIKWRILPLGMDLQIKEYSPFAVIEVYGESWLLTKDGKLLEPLSSVGNSHVVVEASNLPRITGIDEVKGRSITYSSANNRLSYTLEFLKPLHNVEEKNFSIERIVLLEDGAFLVSSKGTGAYPEIIFPYSVKNNFPLAFKKINAIIQANKEKNKKIGKIDLRFNYSISE